MCTGKIKLINILYLIIYIRRCGLIGVEKGMLGIQLMCNSEDRSNFWYIDIEYEAAILYNDKEHLNLKGKFHHAARKNLTLRFSLEHCKKAATKDKGMYMQFIVTIVKKIGIREKRIHDFTVPRDNLTNLILIVDGKNIYCNKHVSCFFNHHGHNSSFISRFLR